MKRFSISAFFPEVKSHVAWQSCSFDASNMGQAVHRALLEIRRRPGVKGKHVTEVRLTVKEITAAGSPAK
jgi:hypothetical protein